MKDSELSSHKEDLKSKNIKIFDREAGKAIENQVFTDLPWDAIKELIEYITKKKNENSVKIAVENQYDGSLPLKWMEMDTLKIRNALTKASIHKTKNEDKSWFKRVDHGYFLGSVIYKYFNQIRKKPLGSQLISLSAWIDNE